MRKNILLIVITLLSANFAMAQFICNISPYVKETGNVIIKDRSNSKDSSIAGDYREHGSGWILLNDHTGAFFVRNIQLTELNWGLDETNGNLSLAVVSYKEGPNKNGELVPNTVTIFLVDIKSDTIIELLNVQTLESIELKRQKFIPGKIYSNTNK